MKKLFLELNQELKHLMVEKNCFIKKTVRIEIYTDDDLPLNEPLKFPTLSVIIGCVLQKGKKLYPQIHLDKRLYEL